MHTAVSILAFLLGVALACQPPFYSIFIPYEQEPQYQPTYPPPTLPPPPTIPPTIPTIPPIGDEFPTLQEEIGPFTPDGIEPLQGGGLHKDSDDYLTCTFSERCCWFNAAEQGGEMEWALISQPADQIKMLVHFGLDRLPTHNFIATAVKHTNPLPTAFLPSSQLVPYNSLISCPILCQESKGTLTFDHWMSEGLAIHVCILGLDSERLSWCDTVIKRDTVRARLTVPAQAKPFMLVLIAASENREGVVAIDNIDYYAEFGKDCDVSTTTTVTPETTSTTESTESTTPNPYEELCEKLSCYWEEEGKFCNYEPLELSDLSAHGDLMNLMHVESSRGVILGNRGTGIVMPPPNAESFVGSLSAPGTFFGIKTKPFKVPTDVDIEFYFYESMDGTDFQVCYDSFLTAEQCDTVSAKEVKSSDRQWRRATFTIPKSGGKQKKRRIFFLSENSGQELGAIGLGPVEVLVDGEPVCAK